jgi:hypothetical protein
MLSVDMQNSQTVHRTRQVEFHKSISACRRLVDSLDAGPEMQHMGGVISSVDLFDGHAHCHSCSVGQSVGLVTISHPLSNAHSTEPSTRYVSRPRKTIAVKAASQNNTQFSPCAGQSTIMRFQRTVVSEI